MDEIPITVDVQGAPKSGLSAQRLERLTRVLADYVAHGEVAGITARVQRRGQEAYAATIGWQDLGARTPMAPDTLFRIASMTKPIIAATALTLIEEGRLRLYGDIAPWLPELAQRNVMNDPNGSPDDVRDAERAITLHDLLTMRFGLGWGASSLAPQLFALTGPPLSDALQLPNAARLTPDSYMAKLEALPLLYEPGQRWLYNVASDVLGVLIARVTGQPLGVALRERLFEPLGMNDTSFAVPAEKRDRLAVLYAPAPGGGLTVRDPSQRSGWAEEPSFPSGGGGLISSAGDYQRFARMLLGGGELGTETGRVRILSRKSLEAMTTDQLTPEQRTQPHTSFERYDEDGAEIWGNKGFGYGVAVRTRRVGLGPSVGSYSWPGAFGTTWLADPLEGLAATLMVQMAWANPFYTQLGEDFTTLLYQAITD